MFRTKSLGLRAGIAALTVALMAYFGYALHAAGRPGPGWVLYGLAVLRGVLFVVEIRRHRQRQRDLEVAMRAEEEAFRREVQAQRDGASADGDPGASAPGQEAAQ